MNLPSYYILAQKNPEKLFVTARLAELRTKKLADALDSAKNHLSVQEINNLIKSFSNDLNTQKFLKDSMNHSSHGHGGGSHKESKGGSSSSHHHKDSHNSHNVEHDEIILDGEGNIISMSGAGGNHSGSGAGTSSSLNQNPNKNSSSFVVTRDARDSQALSERTHHS